MNSRCQLPQVVLFCMALAGVHASALSAPETSQSLTRKPNVLFIAVDDLRPQMGCYGDSLARTPNIDSLAAHGIVFNRAYCQQAVCSPSRSSLLTGCRPDTTQVYDLKTHFRRALPQAVTLPQCFKQNGYYCQSLSKIYHHGFDDPASWSTPAWFPAAKETHTSAPSAQKPARKKLQGKPPKAERDETDPATGIVLKRVTPIKVPKGASWEARDVADNALPDGQTADKAIETLRQLKNKPFFLAVGFIKPHLPFVAPKKYFDLYPEDRIQLPSNPLPPKDVPKVALTDFAELRGYSDIPDVGEITGQKARDLIRGYYAAMSYTDAQIGRVIDELDRLGLRENTIIVLWGDHGWQLGEHGLWCKHTNFELATRSPLLVSVPGGKNAGKKTDALVEFVDVYPTLCQLCGLEAPKKLEGTSFVPVIKDPSRAWKQAAFSQYPRPGGIMGYSMRTDRYRYTEWRQKQGDALKGVELYDHLHDPGENVNLATHAENAELTASLSRMLHQGWRHSQPSLQGHKE